jgi:hypothetical protein
MLEVEAVMWALLTCGVRFQVAAIRHITHCQGKGVPAASRVFLYIYSQSATTAYFIIDA